MANAPTTEARKSWYHNSLASANAMRLAEQNLVDSIALCEAYSGHSSLAEYLKDLRIELAASRKKVFERRNNYSSGQ